MTNYDISIYRFHVHKALVSLLLCLTRRLRAILIGGLFLSKKKGINISTGQAFLEFLRVKEIQANGFCLEFFSVLVYDGASFII